MKEHSIPAVKSIRQLLEGPGGQLRVIAGVPDDAALFPAGLGRAPVRTLLESVLSYIPADAPDHVWVLSVADERLPDNLSIGRPPRRLADRNSAWVFRGKGKKSAALPPPPPSTTDSVRPRVTMSRTRSSSVNDDFMDELGGGWMTTVEKVAELVELACGCLRSGSDYRPDPNRPAGRILLLLDERLLWKIDRSELEQIATGGLGTTDSRKQLNRRLNTVPRLLSESVGRGAPADLIVLAEGQTTARLFRDGMMVNQQMVMAYHRIHPFGKDPDLTKVDERFLAVKWQHTPDAAVVMPRWEKSHPLASNFKGVDTRADLYTNLIHNAPHPIPDPLARLNQLIGLQRVKDEVQGVFAELKRSADRERLKRPLAQDVRRHMVFSGNPGTGKTTVARVVGDLYAERGILSGNKFTEVTDKDLIGEVIGETPRKCEEVFESAAGGVLFIDEAYQLRPRGDNDFAHIVVTAMVRWMTNRPRDLAFILAGYSDEMEQFLNANLGLKSRATVIQFDDYTDDELMLIAATMLNEMQEHYGDGAADDFRAKLANHRAQCVGPNNRFANGREVENLLNACRRAQSLRLYGPDQCSPTDEELSTLTREDVWNAIYPTVSIRGVT